MSILKFDTRSLEERGLNPYNYLLRLRENQKHPLRKLRQLNGGVTPESQILFVPRHFFEEGVLPPKTKVVIEPFAEKMIFVTSDGRVIKEDMIHQHWQFASACLKEV